MSAEPTFLIDMLQNYVDQGVVLSAEERQRLITLATTTKAEPAKGIRLLCPVVYVQHEGATFRWTGCHAEAHNENEKERNRNLYISSFTYKTSRLCLSHMSNASSLRVNAAGMIYEPLSMQTYHGSEEPHGEPAR